MLHKEPKGNKKEDIILFVHGAWHGAWCWDKHFMDFFSNNGYACYALNLSKHDKPGKIKGINRLGLQDYVSDLETAVRSLPQKPIIIAHSMGGIILQKYLERNDCKKGVLLASVPPYGVIKTTLKFLFRTSYSWLYLLTLNLYGLVNSPKKSKWAFFSKNLEDNLVKDYTEKMCSESYKAFLNMLIPNVKINYHLKIPLLVLGAENDQIFSVKDIQNTARKYNTESIIFENMAHDMMLEANHNEVSNKILEWLDSRQ
ncbi:MAG: alpha/beta hydrolase [Bacteroidota bacterium]